MYTPDTPALDFDRYRIVRLLGRGGLGEVYLAQDLTLGRDVAIKFVAPDRLADPDAPRRMLREARAAAALDHPGICTVYETGETTDGRSYIVMQYVEGDTLASRLAREPLTVREALVLCVHVAEALGAAHRRGIVHRDLKPGNVMVTPSGQPKLVDFGIAKAVLSRAEQAEVATITASTTASGLIGSPGYMSPEQIQQRPLDGRSDLFALGVLLFECLTGRRPFAAATSVETLSAILHVHPPGPSTLRPDLTDAHDELCRRLLAKDPADRFQSADEVVGAMRLLLPDTSRTAMPRDDAARTGGVGRESPRPRWLQPAWLAAAAVAVIGSAGGAWVWTHAGGLPPVPPEADVWYQRGTEAIREGAFLTARKALEQAVQIFPQHVLAYARLAEADAELDDTRAATGHLLRVSQLAPDDRRLPAPERLRVQALRAAVLRDVDESIRQYRQLVTLYPADPGAWVDLGRAQETAGLRTDARESYARAIERDRQSPVAHLRLGRVQALESRREAALAAFGEAERLYRARSDVEGETEVLLSRGSAFDAMGELKPARADLERALRLATDAKSIYQRVRTQMALSSVTATEEGRNAQSEQMASAAVQEALTNGLDTVAAIGLVDLAATLNGADQPAKAEPYAKRAIAMAEQRGARATAARAKVQLAAVYYQAKRSAESLALLAEVLPFLKANRYRRYELTALSVAAREHERLDELDQARQISFDILAVAEAVKDEAQVALAASNLASVTTSLGQYPEALRLRERVEGIHRRLGDKRSLPFDLANRADLLIRLGRRADAEVVLGELDEGIAAGIDSYVARKRRATFLRAFAAVTALRCDEARRLIAQFDAAAATGAAGAAGVLAPAVDDFCDARLGGRKARQNGGEAEPGSARERRYWVAAAAFQRQDAATALSEARQGLTQLGTLSNNELRWRLAAVGALAAKRLGDTQAAADLDSTARQALDQVRAAWKADFDPYVRRADIADLRNRAGQS